MKKRNKVIKLFIFLLVGIASMLTFSVLIKSSNYSYSQKEYTQKTRNIGDGDINQYEVKKEVGFDPNNATYNVKYKQNDVWYYDQQKSDFVPPAWEQSQFESWSYNGDMPSFEITYTGDYNGTITPPLTTINSWVRVGGQQLPNTSVYTYEWTDKEHKATNPSIPKNWKKTHISDLNKNWTMDLPNAWSWKDSEGYWNDPHERATGKGNKKVWVDWNVKNVNAENHIIKSGTKNIDTSYDHPNNIKRKLAQYNTDKKNTDFTTNLSISSQKPTYTVKEPYDSNSIEFEKSIGEGYYGEYAESNGESGTDISIGELPKGYTYEVNGALKYEDKNGKIRTYGPELKDKFKNGEKTGKAPEIIIESSSNSENSLTFSYSVIDPDFLRITPVEWKFESVTDGLLMKGSSNSSNFKKTFKVTRDEHYTFEASSYYTRSFDENKPSDRILITRESKPETAGKYYINKITKFETSVENIQDNNVIFDVYVETNNNILKSNTKASLEITELKRKGKSITSPPYIFPINHTGTTSIKLHTKQWKWKDKDRLIFKTTLERNGTKISEPITYEYNLNTNLKKSTNIIIDSNKYINNTEAELTYELESNDHINEIEYSLNGTWNKITKFEQRSSHQTLSLENLNPETLYNVQLKAETNNGNEYFSNNYKFKTDRNTSIKHLDLTSDNNSITVENDVDKFKYLDDPRINWSLYDKDDKKTIQVGTENIIDNGKFGFTINNLLPGHKYSYLENINIEGKTLALKKEIKTKDIMDPDLVNNAYIKDVKKISPNKYKIKYEGIVFNAEYFSFKNREWKKMNAISFDKNNELTLETSEKNLEHVQFKLNYSMNSTYSWDENIDSNLKNPPPIKLSYIVLLLIIIPIFLVATIGGVTIWAWWWKNKRVKKIDVNIWK